MAKRGRQAGGLAARQSLVLRPDAGHATRRGSRASRSASAPTGARPARRTCSPSSRCSTCINKLGVGSAARRARHDPDGDHQPGRRHRLDQVRRAASAPGLYADLAVYTKKARQRVPLDHRRHREGRAPGAGRRRPALRRRARRCRRSSRPTHEAVSSSCGFEKAIDITTTIDRAGRHAHLRRGARRRLESALQFDLAWIQAHWDPGRGLDQDGARPRRSRRPTRAA